MVQVLFALFFWLGNEQSLQILNVYYLCCILFIEVGQWPPKQRISYIHIFLDTCLFNLYLKDILTYRIKAEHSSLYLPTVCKTLG